MANFEFKQPEIEVKEQLKWNEQRENKRKQGYNECKDIIKKFNDMKDLKDNGDNNNIQKVGENWLSKIAMELSNAYGLWLWPNISTLDVNKEWNIEINYTSKSKEKKEKVTIVIDETTAKRKIQYYEIRDNYDVPVWSPTSETLQLKKEKENFRNEDMKKYIWYANNELRKSYANMKDVNEDDLKGLERLLYKAYSDE